MSAPILTKQQQRHSLSAKKTLGKGLRNILAQPQDNYWPIVNAEKCPSLENLLKELMIVIKQPHHMIPWSQLRHMKKEERSQVKREALSNQNLVPNNEITNSVILGLNAITRSMERNNICCALIDANVDPPLLVKHIILMAQNKEVPILLLPNLKTIMLNTIGFASVACALKDIAMESVDHHFYPLYLQIYNIYKTIPLPRNSLQLFKDIETLEETMLCKEDKLSNDSALQSNASESTKFKLSTNVYKYRSSRKERVFIPPTAIVTSASTLTTKEMPQDDFISISNYDVDECNAIAKKYTRYVNIRRDRDTKKGNNHVRVYRKPANVTYLPLKVKRFQGNSNRLKATKSSKQKKK